MDAVSQRNEFRMTYHDMTDEQLAELALDADSLSEPAFEALRDAVRTRGTEKINAIADTMWSKSVFAPTAKRLQIMSFSLSPAAVRILKNGNVRS